MKILRKRIQNERKAKARQAKAKPEMARVDKEAQHQLEETQHEEMQDVQAGHADDPYEMTVWMWRVSSVR